MSARFNIICGMALSVVIAPLAQAQSAMTAYVPEFHTTLQHFVSILGSQRNIDLSRIPTNVRADVQFFYREKRVVNSIYNRTYNEYNRLFDSVRNSYYFNVSHGLSVPGYLYSYEGFMVQCRPERLF